MTHPVEVEPQISTEHEVEDHEEVLIVLEGVAEVADKEAVDLLEEAALLDDVLHGMLLDAALCGGRVAWMPLLGDRVERRQLDGNRITVSGGELLHGQLDTGSVVRMDVKRWMWAAAGRVMGERVRGARCDRTDTGLLGERGRRGKRGRGFKERDGRRLTCLLMYLRA